MEKIKPIESVTLESAVPAPENGTEVIAVPRESHEENTAKVAQLTKDLQESLRPIDQETETAEIPAAPPKKKNILQKAAVVAGFLTGGLGLFAAGDSKAQTGGKVLASGKIGEVHVSIQAKHVENRFAADPHFMEKHISNLIKDYGVEYVLHNSEIIEITDPKAQLSKLDRKRGFEKFAVDGSYREDDYNIRVGDRIVRFNDQSEEDIQKGRDNWVIYGIIDSNNNLIAMLKREPAIKVSSMINGVERRLN